VHADADTTIESGQQATLSQPPDYFAKFDGGQRQDAVAAGIGQEQQHSLASQLSGIAPAHVMVW
jgi:hypothetical protein